MSHAPDLGVLGAGTARCNLKGITMPLKTLAIFAFVILTAVTSVHASSSSPTEQVQDTVDEIIKILRDKSLDLRQRQNRIGTVIDERFDFQSLSQSVLATHWEKATPAEKSRFVQFFSQYIEMTYMKKIENYTNEYVRYDKEKRQGDRAVVDTFIVSGETEIPVSFKLKQNDDEWLAYDVLIEGQSLVNHYRTVYSAMIRSEGIGGLLEDLEGRTRDYEYAKRVGIVRD
jgi:phospholipid transport system substrate-binding protein